MAATSNIDQTRRFALIRYNADGTPDAGFGSNGRAFAALSAIDQDDAYSLALQPNGRLVLAGREGLSIGGPNPIVYVPLIVGFSSTGVVDPTFGDGGPGLIRLGISGSANAIPAQPDGKLLVSATGGSTTARLMRFTVDGHADTTFGAGGAPIITRLLSISSISLQPDGNIVIGGGTASGLSGSSIFPTAYNFAVSRYINGPMAAIEFYNPGLDHYFMSMDPQEVGDLRPRRIPRMDPYRVVLPYLPEAPRRLQEHRPTPSVASTYRRSMATPTSFPQTRSNAPSRETRSRPIPISAVMWRRRRARSTSDCPTSSPVLVQRTGHPCTDSGTKDQPPTIATRQASSSRIR